MTSHVPFLFLWWSPEVPLLHCIGYGNTLQPPSHFVVSQFLLRCSTRTSEVSCRRLNFLLGRRVLQEFYALCYHLLTLSCVLHLVVYLSFVFLCHTLLLFLHCCVCERMSQCGAMFCLYVKSHIFMAPSHSSQNDMPYYMIHCTSWEQKVCIYPSHDIFFMLAALTNAVHVMYHDSTDFIN